MVDPKREPAAPRSAPALHPCLTAIRAELSRHVRREEASYASTRPAPDTLMGHLERVASIAVRLASLEGVDPVAAELAGLFHDAGKFHGGRYHDGDRPEEERSAEVLAELAKRCGLDPAIACSTCDNRYDLRFCRPRGRARRCVGQATGASWRAGRAWH
jgi:hypothetical protein